MTVRPSERDEVMEFDIVLNREIGQFGKYQILNLALLGLTVIFSAIMTGDYVFTAGNLPFRCAVPMCDGPQPEYAPEWILNAIPATASGFDNCNRYANATNYETVYNIEDVCPAVLFDRNTTVPCESYVYNRTNTVVYDFNLECQDWLRTLPGTLNSLGAMVALVFAGFVSDRFGRKISVIFFSFNVAWVGLVRSFSINYPMYVALQFLQTALGGGLYGAAYILAAEIVGGKYRVHAGAMMSTMFATGQIVLGLLAWAIPDWRKLSLVLYIPMFVIVFYYWILSESHRWLLSKNKQQEAKAVLTRAARLNGKPEIPEKSMIFILTEIPRQIEANKIFNKENLFLRVLKSPVLLRRCCTTPVLWIATIFIYYGLSINSVNLLGNIYLNYTATAAIEIPGVWTGVIVLDRIGRKATLCLGFVMCGLCNTAFAFTPKTMSNLSLGLFLTGKYCIGLVMPSVYLFTAELYPTRYRHSFLGFSSMIGRIGSIIAPLTPPLMAYWNGIPSMMFAIMAFISALLVLTQPETKGLKVPDTIEDAEQIGKKK